MCIESICKRTCFTKECHLHRLKGTKWKPDHTPNLLAVNQNLQQPQEPARDNLVTQNENSTVDPHFLETMQQMKCEMLISVESQIQTTMRSNQMPQVWPYRNNLEFQQTPYQHQSQVPRQELPVWLPATSNPQQHQVHSHAPMQTLDHQPWNHQWRAQNPAVTNP